MHVKIAIAEFGWGGVFVVFEEFDEVVFVLKSALPRDVLDRLVGIDEERLDIFQSFFDDQRFGIKAEFASQKLGKMVGTVAKLAPKLGNSQGTVGMNARVFRDLMRKSVALDVALCVDRDQKMRQRQLCKRAVGFLLVHDLPKDPCVALREGKLLLWAERANVVGVKVQPIKGSTAMAFFDPAMLAVGIEQEQIARGEVVFVLFFAYMHLAAYHKDQLIRVDGNRRVDPFVIGGKKPHV